jgi:two-component system, chemotaxis family, chemotaxis protein CheY
VDPKGVAAVIDDSKAIRLILTRTLTRLGFEVVSAEGGAAALPLLEAMETPPAVIFADWDMPGESGKEVVAAIRARPALEAVPLLILIATGLEVEEMYEAFEAGASEYVMKPFEEAEIESKLRLLGLIS